MNKFLYVAWIQAILATLGSLYFSEVLHFQPCNLCWYQRICLFPLIILLPTGIVRKDQHLPYLLLPLSIIGFGIALFHYLLQLGVINETILPCTIGSPCTTKYFDLFGFVTIPFLSLITFSIITMCLISSMRKTTHDPRN